MRVTMKLEQRSIFDDNRSRRSCYQLLLGVLLLLPPICNAVNMQQFLQSLDMMRNGCIGKFKVDVEILDRIREGDFDLEPTKDLLASWQIKYNQIISM